MLPCCSSCSSHMESLPFIWANICDVWDVLWTSPTNTDAARRLGRGKSGARHACFRDTTFRGQRGSAQQGHNSGGYVSLGVVPDTLTTPASKAMAFVIIRGECNRNRKALSKRQCSCLDILEPNKLITPASFIKQFRPRYARDRAANMTLRCGLAIPSHQGARIPIWVLLCHPSAAECTRQTVIAHARMLQVLDEHNARQIISESCATVMCTSWPHACM